MNSSNAYGVVCNALLPKLFILCEHVLESFEFVLSKCSRLIYPSCDRNYCTIAMLNVHAQIAAILVFNGNHELLIRLKSKFKFGRTLRIKNYCVRLLKEESCCPWAQETQLAMQLRIRQHATPRHATPRHRALTLIFRKDAQLQRSRHDPSSSMAISLESSNCLTAVHYLWSRAPSNQDPTVVSA
jgi:hypothetical protein